LRKAENEQFLQTIMMTVSVIIATKNRSEAIAGISLPSLLRQDEAGFEVLIWDASDDALTENAVGDARPSFSDKEINLIYKRAPRSGLPSQRNDAVREAKGDVVFFLDDDSEASSDAVRVVRRYFDDFRWLKGLGLPLMDKRPRIDTHTAHPIAGTLRGWMRRFFLGSGCMSRKIMSSARNGLPEPDSFGTAEWLSGCDMAFRKSVFSENGFDERLELFGGYSFGEDYDFSHRVFLRYGEPLLVASSGCVVHHNFGGGRISGQAEFCALKFYNTIVILENFKKYRRYRTLPFIWEQRIGMILSMLAQRVSPSDIWRGYRMYRKSRCELTADDLDKKISPN
jgi:glycosyltransferase involved in cell wall biosynthesis